MISPYLQPVGPEPIPLCHRLGPAPAGSVFHGTRVGGKIQHFLRKSMEKLWISRGGVVRTSCMRPQDLNQRGGTAPQNRALWPAVRRGTSVVKSINGIGGPPPTSHGWSSPVGGRAGALETKGCARVTLPGVASTAAGRRLLVRFSPRAAAASAWSRGGRLFLFAVGVPATPAPYGIGSRRSLPRENP